MSPEPNSSARLNGPAAVRQVPVGRVPDWLVSGWRDFRRAGWPSLLHGLIVTVAGLVIVAITLDFLPLLPGAVSGFVLVGPILATGLYALSQRLESGQTPRLRDAVAAWRQSSKCLWRLGILLVLAGTAWVAVTALLFHFFVDVDIAQPRDFLRYMVTQNELFVLWAILGGVGAALIFALTVVSVPLLLDRDISVPNALLTSVRAVGDNPIAMGWWATLIMFATGLSIATAMLGFLILYPVLGHASWHVYRDLVDPGELAARQRPE